METDQLVEAPPAPPTFAAPPVGGGDPPPPATLTAAEPERPRRMIITTIAPPDAPANELSVRLWLDDRLQWVQDERQTESVLALSRDSVVIGRRGHADDPRPPLTVNGTLEAAGLAVTGADGGRVRMHLSDAPLGTRVYPVVIGDDGRLYRG